MMILVYNSKKKLKESVGKPLEYIETSFFGPEFQANGSFFGCNRPYSPEHGRFAERKGREFFANVTMKDGLIEKIK